MGSEGKKSSQPIIESASPKTVLQVFHNVVSYGKEENNAASREVLCRWQETLLSHSGEVKEQSLVLPQALLADRPRFERSDLLILNDCNDATQVGGRAPLHEEFGTSGVTLLQPPPAGDDQRQAGFFRQRPPRPQLSAVRLSLPAPRGFFQFYHAAEHRPGDHQMYPVAGGSPRRSARDSLLNRLRIKPLNCIVPSSSPGGIPHG